MLLLALWACNAEYTCTFDDRAVGDVFVSVEMPCSDRRSVGDQILSGAHRDCEAQAGALGGEPASCTCDWTADPCRGPSNE